MIDAASARHLYHAYSELVKFRKNESGGSGKSSTEESKMREIWWQNAVRQAHTSKFGPGGCDEEAGNCLRPLSYLNENK